MCIFKGRRIFKEPRTQRQIESAESNSNKECLQAEGKETANKRSAGGGPGWKKEEKEELRSARRQFGSPAAGWQRLNDLPNNKSLQRYNRTRTEPGNEWTAHLDVATESNDFSFRLDFFTVWWCVFDVYWTATCITIALNVSITFCKSPCIVLDTLILYK